MTWWENQSTVPNFLKLPKKQKKCEEDILETLFKQNWAE